MHLLLAESLRLELRKLNKHKAQSLYHLLAMLHVHYPVIMIIPLNFRHIHIIHQIKRIHRLQQIIIIATAKLPYVCLRSIEQDTAHECRRPYHLHLNYEDTPCNIPAAHIHYAVLLQWSFREKLCRKILHAHNLLILRLEREQGVEKTYHKVGMFSEHLLEGQIGFGV